MSSRRKNNRHRRDLNDADVKNVEESKNMTDLDNTGGNVSDASSTADLHSKKKKKKKKTHSRQLPGVKLKGVDKTSKTNDTLKDTNGISKLSSKRKHRKKEKHRHGRRHDRLENMNEAKELTDMNDISDNVPELPSITTQSARKKDEHYHKKSEKYAEGTKPYTRSSIQRIGKGILKNFSLTTLTSDVRNIEFCNATSVTDSNSSSKGTHSILRNSFGTKRTSNSTADFESKPVEEQQRPTAIPSIPKILSKNNLLVRQNSDHLQNLQLEKLTEQYIKETEENNIGAVVLQIVSYIIYFLIFCVIVRNSSISHLPVQ